MLGGRTNHWGRVSLRMGPFDFKPKSFDGLGFDWPVTYEEVAPFYDKTEQIVGIFGSKEGLENNPDSDYFLPPPKPRAYEHLADARGQEAGRSQSLLRASPSSPSRSMAVRRASMPLPADAAAPFAPISKAPRC